MKNLLKWIGHGIAVFAVAVIVATPFAWSRISVTTPAEAFYGFVSTNLSRVIYRIGGPSGTNSAFDKLTSTGVVGMEMDRREISFQIADLATANSHYLIAPTTGVIERIDVVFDKNTTAAACDCLTGTATVLSLFVSNLNSGAGVNPSQYLSGTQAQYLLTKVSNFGITLSVGARPGVVATDDTIEQVVNQGDVIAIETDGGATNATAMVGRVTVQIRAPY